MKKGIIITQILGGLIVVTSFFLYEDDAKYLTVIGFLLLLFGKLVGLYNGFNKKIND